MNLTCSLKALQSMTREQLIEWLTAFDRNGDYTDERVAAQGMPLLTHRSALALAVGHLFDTGSLEKDVPAPTLHELARSFCSTLRDWLTAEQLEIVNENNHRIGDRGICATHEFCDANMAMQEAFRYHGILTPVEVDEGSIDHDVLVDLWNSAWSIARDAGFDPAAVVDPVKAGGAS